MTRRVHIYERDTVATEVVNPTELAAEPVLPGFVLNLTAIWEPSL